MTHFLTQQGPAELIWHREGTRRGFSHTERALAANMHNTPTNPPCPKAVDRLCLKTQVGIKRRKPEIQLTWS